jgi:hypothetical protein
MAGRHPSITARQLLDLTVGIEKRDSALDVSVDVDRPSSMTLIPSDSVSII